MNGAILAAFALDLALGDPPGLPHPVRWMGRAIHEGERMVRAWFPTTPNGERIAGAVLVVGVVGGTVALSALTFALVRRGNTRMAQALNIIMAASTLATRDLLDEVDAVYAALAANDLVLARARVSRIVGRDTTELDAAGVARAAIESLAESTCDGIVAPLVFLACGGVPAAMAFKAISTLDSTIGHYEAPYRYFGSVGARIDDIANVVPARLSAVLIALLAPLVGGSSANAARVVLADARKHRSPNAGFPEAAMAGALGIQLGGASTYDGVKVDAPFLGVGRAPHHGDVRTAMRLCLFVACAAAVLATIVGRRG